ncbi:MAG TPA: hypothetical protein PLA72_10605, partial [Smithellaceae bacterium]|nr:hypothetical protein [Smithellaceae bacterium]
MKLFIYCAGGFGKEIMDVARRINNLENRWDEIYFIDDNARLGKAFYGTKLFTFDMVLDQYNINTFEIS